MIYDYKQANWQLFQSTIDNLIPINPTIKTTADLEQAAKNFETAIQQATITAIPKLKKIRNQITLPALLAYLLRLKNYSRRRFQRLRTPTTRFLFTLLSRIFLTKLQQLKNTKWNLFLNTLHPQTSSVWKISRYFTTPKQKIPPLLCNGTQIYLSSEKAEALAHQFERSHNLTLHTTSSSHSQVITRTVNKAFRSITPTTLTIQPTNPLEIRRHARSFKTKTTPGIDGITNTMLIHLSPHAIQHLTLLFNSILQLGYFPTIWKSASHSNPQTKKPPTDTNSYRPFSLLSSISKLLERIVATRLTSFIQ